MSAHVFSLINQKGGIGKTTSAIHIGVGLQRRGYRTLIIDMDAQCNLTFSLNGDYQNKPTIMEAILGKVDIFECIQHLVEIDVIPGSSNLSTLESRLEPEGKEFFLDEAIEPLRDIYDFIIIDSPPALSLITVGIMCAANSVIIPVALDMYSLQGTGQLYRTFSAVKQYCNENLVIDGILINQNAVSLKKLLKDIANNMSVRVFKSAISSAVIVKHAVIAQQSLYKYAPDCKVVKEFNGVIDELLEIRRAEKEADRKKSKDNDATEPFSGVDIDKDEYKESASNGLEDALNEIGIMIDEPKEVPKFRSDKDILVDNLSEED